MKRMKSVLAMLLALMMLFSLAACGSETQETQTEAPATEAPADDGNESTETPDDTQEPSGETGATTLETLRLGIYGDATYTGTFDPSGAWAGTGAGYGVVFTVYDTLFYIDSTGEYNTRTVESYEWTDDTTLVIQLKDGIMFSNGTQLTGKDVLYSLGLMQNSGMRSGYYTPFDIDSSSYSDDGLTITLKTFEPYAAYYAGLDFAIVSADYMESMGGGDNMDWYDPAQVVGSGPYTCTELVSGASATYVKRDDYWGLEYGYDDIYENIEVTQYTDQTTMCIDFETGALDVAIDLSVQDYDRLAADTSDNFETKLINSNVVYQLVFDSNNNEYLQNATVREALCHAVDTASLCTAVAGTFGVYADSMFGKNEIGYVGGLDYEYDPELSRSLLEEAGYGDGFTLHFATIGSEPYTTIAEIVQGYFAEVGVTVEIESLELATFISSSSTPGFTDMQIYTMTGGNPSGEPVVHLDNWYPDSTSPVMTRGEEYEELLIGGETSLDEETRAEYYAQLQQLWHDNFDGVPLYEYSKGYVYNTDVFEDLTVASSTVLWLFDAKLK